MELKQLDYTLRQKMNANPDAIFINALAIRFFDRNRLGNNGQFKG